MKCYYDGVFYSGVEAYKFYDNICASNKAENRFK